MMKQVFILLAILVLSVSALRGYGVNNRYHYTRMGMVTTDKGASTDPDVSADKTGGISSSRNDSEEKLEVSVPHLHIGGDNLALKVSKKDEIGSVGTTLSGNSKVMNLKKAPGQDLPEVLKSWNELQGLSERELLSNDDPSFQRSQESLGLAYRR